MPSPSAWARLDRRSGARFTLRVPTVGEAGIYSSAMHYPKAIEATKSDDGPTAAATMRRSPVADFFAKHGTLREDGRMVVYDLHLARVKAPAASRYPWDYDEIREKIPGDKGFGPRAVTP
jgi:branched-chain amino acid transport system substrate-binding protein